MTGTEIQKNVSSTIFNCLFTEFSDFKKKKKKIEKKSTYKSLTYGAVHKLRRQNFEDF